MEWKKEYKPLIYIVGAFLVLFFLPIEASRFQGVLMINLVSEMD